MDVQMEVNNEMYPIEKVTNFDIYIDLKPSEKEAKERKNSSAEKLQMDDKKGPYKHYKDVEKEQLFFLVEEKGMGVGAAAQKLNINVRTAQQKCRITFKKAHLQPVERNRPEKIEQRYEWVKKWMETDLDFTSNCVFIDEAVFHINLKRNFSWPKEGSRAVVQVARSRAKTTTILGAISPFGVVNISRNNGGTVTGHYFNFISSVLDVMDRHEQFHGHYLVMDNVLIHTHEDIQKHIESRGYGYMYLPPYSPELNPIEQFWSVCKSKLKRELLLDEETLTTRIADACNRALYSDLQGFCRYSASKFDDCLNRKPI
ncbi:hypothetical protein RO3G_14342 [Rhizopus delemar RA 99-880]|uniref:Tc1-like transposase DDE domain-containing protein n=1 Tax=Rhizopus delemar (strain RA 99-880 / ATCC MYA-4621 / FGSC 9543 / NRRL 43880) TaxID=246409 RepID=I1CMF1_RHIO9|nr:hypothetical protein RO3G_14342 [Rhizopus delemar RA 99-880]|eukprot:EIE89631.1 hypothetical protein RO3G_14342 [Rhizopus delemar RA 99-880]